MNGYPDDTAETALADFLDHGHCLFVSSQEYLYNLGSTPTPFMQDYLGVNICRRRRVFNQPSPAWGQCSAA